MRKSFYGLKQADLGHCLETLRTSIDWLTIRSVSQGRIWPWLPFLWTVYLVASRRQQAVTRLGQEMSTRFEVRDLGNVGYCLGIEITQNGNHIAMNQRGYIKHLLNRFGMIDSEPLATSVDRSVNLKKNEFPNEEDARLLYREHVGALTYLTSTTRLDVIFVESYLGQFNNCYRVEHWNTAKCVLRYLTWA